VALALGSLGDFQHLHRGYISDGGLAEHFDACAVLDWLAKQSCVDADQVALLGFSMGAQATLDAVKPGFIENKSNGIFVQRSRITHGVGIARFDDRPDLDVCRRQG